MDVKWLVDGQAVGGWSSAWWIGGGWWMGIDGWAVKWLVDSEVVDEWTSGWRMVKRLVDGQVVGGSGVVGGW